MNIKSFIIKSIGFDFGELSANVENLIIESVSADKGDYSLPCFSFAKILRDNPCIHSSMNACDCACESGEHSMNDTSCSHGHQGCDANCVTNFQTINPEDADVELSDESFCSLFYAWADILFTSSPLLDVKANYESLYLEKLSITCQPHVMGLRAPPYLCA